MQKKILSISLLVSGREDTTEKCLTSLQPLMEQLDSELILVDTGCSEELRKKLVNYTTQIISFTWCNDFAKARNAGLEKATGEWFLFLDDDEWFEDVTPIIEFFQSGEYKEYNQAVYYARNYSKLDGSTYSDDFVSRMMRLEPDTHFEGAVHEELVPVKGKCKRINAFVHHYGYAFPDEETKQKHYKRNIEILLKMKKEQPDNLRWPLHLLKEYYVMHDGNALREEALEAIELIENIDVPFTNLCRGSFYSAVLQGDVWEDEYTVMKQHTQIFEENTKNSNAVNCAIEKYAAVGAYENQDMQMLAVYCKKFFTHYDLFCKEEMSEQEQIILESILWVNEAVKEEAAYDMCLKLEEALLELGKGDEVPEEQKELLINKIREQLDGKGEFMQLPEIYWKLGEQNMIPLENLLLELPISQWMAQVMMLERQGIDAWDATGTNMSRIRTRQDIRYAYYDFHYVNYMIESSTQPDNYEEMNELLTYYMECNMNYANLVYTEAAFEGGMEMLPDSVKGAVWVAKAFEYGFESFDQMLECLGRSVKEYPALADKMRSFIQMLGEEKEAELRAQNQETSQARNELEEMAVQVKGQIQVMIQSQMYAEAYQIVQQLRGMLPEDQELIELEEELKKKLS